MYFYLWLLSIVTPPPHPLNLAPPSVWVLNSSLERTWIRIPHFPHFLIHHFPIPYFPIPHFPMPRFPIPYFPSPWV